MPHCSLAQRPFGLLVGAVLIAGLTVACDPQADLEAYFAATPDASATPTPTPSPVPTPSPSPTASPSPTPSPSPSPSPTPSPTASPIGRPTGSPSPTRPPNLPAFSVLREQADVVPYDRLLAQPARYEGQLLFFEGRVGRVTDDGRGSFRARIRIAGGQLIHLVYDERTYWGQPLVQGDRIRVVGYFRGLSDAQAHGERVPVIEIYDLLLRFT